MMNTCVQGSRSSRYCLRGTASAEETSLADRLWPRLPEDHSLSLEQQIEDRITEVGNQLGLHLGGLSHDMVGLEVDGRGQRARLRVGAGNVHYLTFKMDTIWHFADGKARVATRVDLGLAGRELHVELPDFEMVPTSYGSERYVELRLPLWERRF
jgi:hypothetical protein